jgi:diguanylate cyclase (GGDEF)-like protein/PAS domain S-box-containing protein
MDQPPAAQQQCVRPGGWAAFRQAHLYDYNPAATRYWVALAGAGGLASMLAAASVAAGSSEALQIAGWLLVVAFAAAFPIEIPRSKHSVVGSDIAVYLLLVLHGTPSAVLAAALEGSIAGCRSSRRLTSRVATTAAGAVSMALAGTVFTLAQYALVQAGLAAAAAQLAALALASLVHCAFGTASLMQVMYLKRGLRMSLRDWFDNGSWMATLLLISALVAGLLALNAQQFGRSTVVVGVAVVGLSLALLRAHFRLQIAEHQAQEARVTAAEQDAQQNQQRFHSAFTQASIGMAIVSADGRVLQANQALHSLLRYDGTSIVGRSFRSLLHAGDAELLERHLAELQARRAEQFSIELRCVGVDRHEAWVSLHCAPFDDAGHGEAGLIFQLHDITSRRRAEGELRHIAFHDPLTDLANRNCFQERLTVAVERSRTDPQSRFAVMMLDLDRFKIVNDSLGHGAGDELLKEVGCRLAACLRPKDLVARLGGDEFAVLIEDTQASGDVVRLGERLLQALDKPVQINGTELRPQASLGVTFSDMGYREPDEVLRDADLAMYRAKANGKGCLALFDASLHEHLGHKLQLEADLRRAIGEGQLSLAFQPLFDLEPHRLNGFEALARWTHPTRGSISPTVFIALAEETGCIEALTAWAIDEAVRQHVAWQREAAPYGALVMHVNVSGKDLARPQFVPHVRAVLQRHGLPAGQLLLEITESTLMEHRELALQALAELSELGVKLGIDDFGTGYSSLAYLSTLPFDCLKIDRSFVIGMDKSKKNLEIVRTVVTLGRSLNKQVVAEGIETHEQLVRLRQLGATIGQGYLLSRPLNPLQVRSLLQEPCIAPL